MDPRKVLVLLGACTGLAAVSARAEPADPSLVELVEVADISGVAASPDGRFAAFRTDRPSVASNSYVLAWHVIDLSTGAERRIAAGGDPIIADPGLLVAEAPIWSADGRWIFYRALAGGAIQIWRAAADGSGGVPVTAEEGDILSLERASDGALRYRVGPSRAEIARAEEEEYDRGILVDEHVELGQNLFRGAIINGRRATQRLTGQWFARGGLLWARPPAVKRLDPVTLAVAPISAEDGGGSREASAPRLDAEAVSSGGDVASARREGRATILAVERAGGSGRTATCAAAECRTRRVAWLAWRPGRDQLVFAGADAAHRQGLFLWDIAANRVQRVASGDGLLSGGRSAGAPCALTGSLALCVVAGPAAPPRLEAIGLETGRRRILFDPNAALRARRWPAAEPLEWRSAEGRLFTGTLFRPASRGRALPLFINFYRCEGFLRGGVGDEWPFAAFAAAGIAAVCVNATQMSGPQDGVGQYRAALGGIEALIDMLARRGDIDPARAGMGGLSFGSEVTMWTVIHSGLIAAASVASPQFEASSYWLNGVRGRDHHQLMRQVWGLGAPEETPEQWRLLSPALNIERIHAPLLMQLSEQESRYAAELYARLSNSATPTELYVFPDEAHIKSQPRHRLAVYRRNLDWFRFWLQGRADEDPGRADQYARWRLLAERRR